ncbi:polynucleotide adenylyltransferase PcnB [Coxiella endosymbiont of Amblyomma sculptum]|uniref:polynucleotide adenylyltransferase PcnB n=1 Tax=Coxiella endosymbiont of Amblyomma sculptum TaxID=2487929 RepID=UPI001FEC54E2|nr:polynucleotide adenylyltransferase PcnB [Coxiella endosymbiont of Amblyomma sculptum]
MKRSISHDEISSNALRVLYRLSKAGYEAFLVGGSVRDMLLGFHPKDFDVATNARPIEIRKLFGNSRLIGKRFRLVHVCFPNEIIEVSTFRAGTKEYRKNSSLVLVDDNTYGTIEEDACRRDFTINALYYDVTNFSIVDLTNGMQDLKTGLIRMIGDDPSRRYQEDPVRLLRAVRLASKLNFKIHPNTEEPLLRLHNLLHYVPSARLFTELLKMFCKGHAHRSFQLLTYTNYMKALFPEMVDFLEKSQNPHYRNLIEYSLKSTDERYRKNLTLNPGFLLAIFLWPVVQELIDRNVRKNKRLFSSLYYGIQRTLNLQTKTLAIPRRLEKVMRSIWLLQYHLEQQSFNRISQISQERFFRAALNFLELREHTGAPLTAIVCWWRIFRDGSVEQRERLIDKLRGEYK